jgi:hypothetical protein
MSQSKGAGDPGSLVIGMAVMAAVEIDRYGLNRLMVGQAGEDVSWFRVLADLWAEILHVAPLC